MKYIPIQIKGEWMLREATNPYQMNADLCELEMYHDWNKNPDINARHIINHDGRESYDSSELISLTQMLSNAGQWFETSGIIQGHHNKQRQVWKYIGEKPVEKAFEPTTDNERLSFIMGYKEGEETEHIRIIGIIKVEIERMGKYKSNRGRILALENILTKINNNGNENS